MEGSGESSELETEIWETLTSRRFCKSRDDLFVTEQIQATDEKLSEFWQLKRKKDRVAG